MAAPRRVIELALSDEELERLSRSRTEPASRVARARMLVAHPETPLSRSAAVATPSSFRSSAVRCGRTASPIP
jgi:hypothetical protein